MARRLTKHGTGLHLMTQEEREALAALIVAVADLAQANHTHDAAAIISGVLDPARIPILSTHNTIASASDIAALTVEQQAEIVNGTIVTTTGGDVDGWRWVYISGSKTDPASYVKLADLTPHWNEIADKPQLALLAALNVHQYFAAVPALDVPSNGEVVAGRKYRVSVGADRTFAVPGGLPDGSAVMIILDVTADCTIGLPPNCYRMGAARAPISSLALPSGTTQTVTLLRDGTTTYVTDTVTAALTSADVIALVSAATGAARLSYNALKDLPDIVSTIVTHLITNVLADGQYLRRSGTGLAGGIPSGGTSSPHFTVGFCATPSASVTTWSTLPLAEAFFMGSARTCTTADLTGCTEARLVISQHGQAVAGAKLAAKYKAGAFSTTLGDYTSLGTSALEIPLATDANPVVLKSAWIPLAAGAKADVFLAVIGSGGSGSGGPAFSNGYLEFR